jgi:small subunit ribosomal protein S17
MDRQRRKVLEGEVVSSKPNKTITVKVTRDVRHLKYEKLVKKCKKYYAHDEENSAQEGQRVRIMECRPMSKLKRWRLVEIIE